MKKSTFLFWLVVLIAINAIGLFNDIFTGDSALYAVISKLFKTSGDYLNIYVQGKDWLDKPHFPFWTGALSMEVFGVNTFAYKLPSFLFSLLGVFYTYKLADKLYNKHVAQLASLILLGSLHIVISNNDVRAEAILVGTIAATSYYMFCLTEQFRLKPLLLASAFAAASIMTKGIFVLIIPYAAILGHLLFNGQLKTVLNYKWIIIMPLLILVMITPELYALWVQFDSNPEAVAFGQKGVSGIKFFLWDSQFGRFFNTGPIKGRGDFPFFFHTFLWGFAPWGLLSFWVIGKQTKDLITHKKSEYVSYFGFVVMFLIFATSKFQLSHYLNILFPFVAISLGAWLHQQMAHGLIKRFTKIALNLYALLLLTLVILLEHLFTGNLGIIAIICVLAILGILYFFNFSKRREQTNFAIFGVTALVVCGFYVNTVFYPNLLTYQSGAQVAFYANTHHKGQAVADANRDWLMEYYLKGNYKAVYQNDTSKLASVSSPGLIYCDDDLIEVIKSQKIDYKVIKTFDHFHITLLDLEFINQATRDKAVKKRHLVEVY